MHILMIVWKCDAENTCSVYDPTDIEAGIQIIEIDRKNVTPLPVIIPDKPLRRWEHAENAEVLSLWPNGDDWTTEFYKARVVKRPCDRVDEPERGYELEFEKGAEHVIVPEKFIAVFPK